MLAYGDRRRKVRVAEALAQVEARADFVLAAELAQGLVDAEFEARGADDLTPLHEACVRLLRTCARGRPDVGPLRALTLPIEVEAKEAEGFAHYAVYPQAYRAAAAGLPGAFVIGIRSIGLGLSAMVAEGAGAVEVASVRPVGPPFQRELQVSEQLKSRLAAHAGAFAVVDEGPGLSGSSFGAVLDLLQALGVGLERVVAFPSHGGDLGPEASAAHRARWRTLQRRVADWRPDPAALFEDLTGPAAEEDLSGGAWRRGRPLPAFPQQERIKVRLGGWIARFAGLGAAGEAKLARARALHAAGFGPEPAALREGFLLTRWVEGVPGRPTLDELAAYLRVRMALPHEGGADLETLAEMVRVNAAELGLELDPPLPRARPRPVAVDGRLHGWEWLRTPAGRIVKLDGLDHCCAHDLVGGQDIAWDVAGAAVELGLSEADAERLRAAVGADPELTGFCRLAYPAFQAGLWSFAGEADEVARYRAALEKKAAPSGAASSLGRKRPKGRGHLCAHARARASHKFTAR